MTLRAVIFDVYRTLLEVLPPPADAEAHWTTLWRDQFGTTPRLDLARFGQESQRVIAREHAAARAAGIAWPEIFWPDVVGEVLPELTAHPLAVREAFMTRQVALWHTVRLMPGAASVLRQLRDRGVRLGIASNAQPYTLPELDGALASAGLRREIFEPELCFWSFAHGFSKPDPHVFRILTTRLRALGIAPAQTLMVGDRLDNDIAPARAHGWQTWHLTDSAAPDQPDAGTWVRLMART